MKRTTKILLIALVVWLSPAICTALYRPIGIVKTLISNSFATVFSSTYDTATPAGTDSPTEADDRMREIKAAVQERMNVDHYWPLTGTEVSDADAGEHRKILFHAPITATPTVAASHGDLRIKDVTAKAELHWTDEDENEIQLTSGGNLHTSQGFTMLSGKIATIETIRAVDSSGVIIETSGGTDAILVSDTAIVTLTDGAKLASSAAPTADAELANKKYVDDQDTAITDPAYSGGESHTFIGGLILKFGSIAESSGDNVITFGVAFPNAIISASSTPERPTATTVGGTVKTGTLATTGFTIMSDGSSTNLLWQAWGH